MIGEKTANLFRLLLMKEDFQKMTHLKYIHKSNVLSHRNRPFIFPPADDGGGARSHPTVAWRAANARTGGPAGPRSPRPPARLLLPALQAQLSPEADLVRPPDLVLTVSPPLEGSEAGGRVRGGVGGLGGCRLASWVDRRTDG